MLTLALVVAAAALVVTVGDTVAPSDEPRMEFENGNVSFSDGDSVELRVVETGNESFETIEVKPSRGSIDVEVTEYADSEEVVKGEFGAQRRNLSAGEEIELESEYRLDDSDESSVTVKRVPTSVSVNVTNTTGISDEEVENGTEFEFETEENKDIEMNVSYIETEDNETEEDDG